MVKIDYSLKVVNQLEGKCVYRVDKASLLVGSMELMAILMDDFDLVLRQDFKDATMAYAFTHLRKLVILHPDYPCMVDFVDVRRSASTLHFTALSTRKSIDKKQEPLFLFALMGNWNEGETSESEEHALPKEMK